MSSFDFSPEQQQAIASRGENLLVAAGAGSGKTSVLVERIIRRLSDREHPGSLQRLLVLTFTNAAAADMRAKIHGALTAMVKAEPDNRHILQELHQLPQASIGTLHSFCLNLLRRYYYRLELDGGFRIARETELVLLEDEVLENYLEQQYGQENGQAQALADAYGGGRDDRQLVELIQELYQFSRSQPHPEQWLQQACAFDGESLDDYPFAPFLRRYLQKQGEIAGVYLAQAAELARSAPELLPEGWLWALKEELAGVNRLAAGGDLVSLLSTLHALEFQPLRGGKKDHNQPFRQEFKNLRNQGREEIKELQQRFGLGKPAQLLADLRALSVLTEPLARFTCEYGQALSTEKRKRNLIDFGDMEHLAYALLQQEDIAQELQQGFDEVLIDEYQDINAVQEEILRLVQTGNNCFAVGDVKQSIYRFRLAEPSLFLDKYAAYGKLTGGRRIDLNRNYRSTGGVIDGINYIFGQLMSMPIAEMDYDQAASLKAGREEYGQPTELLLADLSGNAPRESGEAAESSNEEEEGAENEDLDALTAETRLIGGRIRQLLTEGYTLDEMAVLLRTAKNRVAVVARELNAMGIAAVADQQDSFLKAPEIVLLLSLLKIIDNPRQDIALGAVLRSPLAGFTPEQLVEIRLAAKGDFYLAFTACAAKEGELADRCRGFLTRLTAWRELARKEKISVLLRQLWQDTGIYHLAGALSDGKRRQANLDAFYAQACVYEAEDYRGLYRFIRFLEQVRDKGRELPAVYPQPQKAAVRIMSIHRSKGLEFKVVFVAGLGCRFHGAGGQQDLLWHKDLGLGPKVANREQRIKYPSLAYQAIAAKLRGETAAEELRIFYVALTRARERLILTAALRNPLMDLQNWAETAVAGIPQLPPTQLLRDKRPIDWLGRAILRHPDAVLLRDAAGGGAILAGPGHWRCLLVAAADLPVRRIAVPLFNGEHAAVLPDQELLSRVKKALDFRYPYRESCTYPAKWTVSRLVAADDMEGKWQKVGGGAEDDREQAALRGTVNHLILEKLDFSQDLGAQIEQLQKGGILTAAQADAADIPMLEDFLHSELGRRMAAADRLEREISFTMTIGAEDFVPSHPGDRIILQGTMDAAFWEQNGWVLVDYKTGGFGKTKQQLQQRYQGQLHYYRQAIERIWRQPVKEMYLYMLDQRQSLLLAVE